MIVALQMYDKAHDCEGATGARCAELKQVQGVPKQVCERQTRKRQLTDDRKIVGS